MRRGCRRPDGFLPLLGWKGVVPWVFSFKPGRVVLWDKDSGNPGEVVSLPAAFFYFCRNIPGNARLLPLRVRPFVDWALPLWEKSPCAFREKCCMVSGKVLHVFGKSASTFCAFPCRFLLTGPARRGRGLEGWLFLVFCVTLCSYACLFLWSAFFRKGKEWLYLPQKKSFFQ